MFDRLSFVLGEAFIAMRRNLAMALATVITAAVALFLLGSFAFVYQSAAAYTATMPNRFDMRVNLRMGTPFAQVRTTIEAIRKMPGVASARWIPRDKAWERERQLHPEFTEGIENPYPDAIKVNFNDLRQSDAVAGAVQALPTVEPKGVNYLRDEQKIVVAAVDTFRAFGPPIGGALFIAAGILIYNTILLTVLSRRLEVRIMELVGASRFVVRFPFLIEGFVQGTLGGLIAAGLLIEAERLARVRLAEQSFALAPLPTTQAMVLLVGIGAGYGLLCSFIAVLLAPLRYR